MLTKMQNEMKTTRQEQPQQVQVQGHDNVPYHKGCLLSLPVVGVVV